jgi:hypothetical protein
MSTTQAVRPRKSVGFNSPGGILDRYFYFFMSLLIAVVVAYGFSRTVSQRLFHPTPPRPLLLYFHAAVFTGWVAFFIFQSALVRVRKVQWHRLTGWFGVALGTAIPILGISTSVVMGRFNVAMLHQQDSVGFLMVPLWDITCFAAAFGLAVYWRKKPEYHRRLVLIASCALTAAAFGRFPEHILPPIVFYAGVDALILLGVVRDLIVNRRIHKVYRYALPLLIFGQVFVMHTIITSPAWWMRIARAILA